MNLGGNVVNFDDDSANLNKGRITFKHNNMKNLKKQILKISLNVCVSLFCGIMGSMFFMSIYLNYFDFNNGDFKINMKYDSNVTNVINKLNQSIVGVNAYIKNLNDEGEVVLTQNNMTGVIYSEDGYIVTNFNGLHGADKIYIKFPTALDLVREAEIIAYDEIYDLCLLKIEGTGYVKGNFKEDISDVTHGLKVVSIGNMNGDANSYSVYSGIVNSVDFYDNSVRAIKSDFYVNSLNTGGPVCDVDGEILSINSLKLNDKFNDGVFISISSPSILKFIDNVLNGAT